jgi:L-methionine (R)-S-oxide reductase
MKMSNLTPEYNLLIKQLDALLNGETNQLTNISQFNALIFNLLPDLNWAGFYIFDGEQTLQLGPFQGQVACTKIKLGQGVCGSSASQLKSILVDDVEQFAGHIACDSRSRSELVVPISISGQLWGVFDLDSPILNRFTEQDRAGVEALVEKLIKLTKWNLA